LPQFVREEGPKIMRWALIGLLIAHGLIHLMGFAKAFGIARLPQLTETISRARGVLWLVGGGLVVAAAVLLAVGARTYWIVPLRLAGYGEARWRLPEGEFTYGEFTMVDAVTNVR
jgi:hypothetical protein